MGSGEGNSGRQPRLTARDCEEEVTAALTAVVGAIEAEAALIGRRRRVRGP